MHEETACTLGEGIHVRGNVTGSGSLILRGRIEGLVSLDGHFVVEQPGEVVAQINARTVTVHGQGSGDFSASQKLELTSKALLIGDVHAPEIEIHDGARFQGNLDMKFDLPNDI